MGLLWMGGVDAGVNSDGVVDSETNTANISADAASESVGVVEVVAVVLSFVFRPSSTNPAFPLFLLFCGGAGLSVKPRGAKAPLARKTTSRQRLQSSSSS